MATSPIAVHLGTTSSTQDDARRLFEGRPVVVTAARQTAGRGRSGARWIDADRALAVSLALRPAWPEASWGRVPLVAGLAAADVLGDLGLKWPNDVIRGDDKIAGILTEAADGVVVVGMGVNLWWRRPIDGAGSLWDQDHGIEEARMLGEVWAIRMLTRMQAEADDWGRAEYQERCAVIGEEITWEPDGHGVAVGIDGFGRLIVEVDDELVALDSGAVRMVRKV
ncbi:MAG TPA: biotin--[acetyl-CoA-carboxylase] ligase [Acidimicrobiia bacterium]|nr:biotin--[acetyl-CoA-carboxylase] ligase [Acidimicrobiia bacterium]